MTQDEIIRMAREAGFEYAVDNERWYRFAALVAAHEREKYLNLANEVAWSVALAEREACAKVCEEGWKEGIGAKHQGDVFAVAIRARSK